MQTNTLAALTNLAPHMSGLTSHAAQRLVSLFDMVARKHSKLAQYDSSSTLTAPSNGVNGADAVHAGCWAQEPRSRSSSIVPLPAQALRKVAGYMLMLVMPCAGAGTDAAPPESQVFADFMRIILEVINCILTSNLAANPQLVCPACCLSIAFLRGPTAVSSNAGLGL